MESTENKIVPQEDALVAALLDKTKRNTRGVPTMNFIDDIKEWTDKYTSDKLLLYLNQYLNKFKYMEQTIIRSNENVKLKIPDIEKCLESIEFLEKKDKKEAMKVDYMVSNSLWAKAEVENPETVFLWLGANIMCEYKLDEAKTLLSENLNNAYKQIKDNESDLDFVKDQMTICEVNIARCYNEAVRRKAVEMEKKKQAEGQKVGTTV